MIEAFLWGSLGAAFLLVGAWWAYRFHPSRTLIAVVMAIGSGLLIGSVAYGLIDEALKTQTVGRVGLFVLLGASTFAAGDWLVSRQGGSERKDPGGKQSSGSPLGIQPRRLPKAPPMFPVSSISSAGDAHIASTRCPTRTSV